jgi:predicted polyphosphate/ATP-dependent NAD kinase
MTSRIGLIINPIAGLGGSVGLKGSDGIDTVRHALALGAVPQANMRTIRTLKLARSRAARAAFQLLTPAGPMGQDAACAAGFSPTVLSLPVTGSTTAAQTRAAITELLDRGIDLLVFAGGDGTARDVCGALGESLPCIGIPAGVKIYSGVFGRSPAAVADVIARWSDAKRSCVTSEVVDTDEEAVRQGRPFTRPFGFLSVPDFTGRVQSPKSPVVSEVADLDGIAREVVSRLPTGTMCVLGPGTTTRAVGQHLGLAKTLLGVDVICDRTLVAGDASEKEILRISTGRLTKIVVTPIGGQGHVLGRGNQQLSPAVLQQSGLDNLIVIATPAKLAGLPDHALTVDTGSPNLDNALAGYIRVVTGWRREAVCPVEVY